MNIPTHKFKTNLEIYKTKDTKLIDYLKDKEFLPINFFNDVAIYINNKDLVALVKTFYKEVGDG